MALLWYRLPLSGDENVWFSCMVSKPAAAAVLVDPSPYLGLWGDASSSKSGGGGTVRQHPQASLILCVSTRPNKLDHLASGLGGNFKAPSHVGVATGGSGRGGGGGACCGLALADSGLIRFCR